MRDVGLRSASKQRLQKTVQVPQMQALIILKDVYIRPRL